MQPYLRVCAQWSTPELKSLQCSSSSELPVRQTEALPEQGLGYFIFSSNHLTESDLTGGGGREGKSKIKKALNTSILF